MEMTFDEKFTICLQNFDNISKPDFTSKQLDYYADFIELVVLLSNDDGITVGDILDKFFGEKEYDKAIQRDRDESFVQDIFILIEQRLIFYKNDYPFTFVNSEILKLRSDISNKNKLYLTLLISSQLKIFKEFQPLLTTEFELISQNTLTEFLPTKAIVKSFGKNSLYTGNAITKIKKLADELNLSINQYELSHVSERNMQERGLDIVGWIPFEDNCQNKIIFLGQCACGKDYESKQHDTRRFENYYYFYKTNPQHTLFIPYSLINFKADKFNSSDLIENDYLVFERKRILEYSTVVNSTPYPSFQIVDSCIGHLR